VFGLVVVFACLLAGGTATAVGAYAWFQRARQPGAGAFAALMLGATVWSLSYAVALVTFDPVLRRGMEVPIEVGKAIIGPAWFLFALEYTGRGEYVTRRSVAAVMVIPAATVVATAVDGGRGLMWTGYELAPSMGLATVSYDPAAWFFFHAVYGYVLIAVGLAAVVQTVLREGSLYRGQTVALVVGALPPTVANVKRTLEIPPFPTLDLTPIGLAITGLAFGYALFRFDLLGFAPASRTLGRRAAVDNVGVGVAVVADADDPLDGTVVEANDRLAEIVDRPTGEVVGRPLSASLPPGARIDDDDPLAVEGAAGRRRYELTAADVTDHHGRVIARTVTFTDVTAREQRRQRLDVLNRVLRHNLRNDMNVVRGHARTLAEDLDGRAGDSAAAIERTAGRLVRVGEKARQIDRIVAAPDGSFDAVPTVRTATRTAVRRVEDDRGESVSSVSVSLPEAAVVAGAPESLAVVVENLVENALRHGAPPVVVGLRATESGYDLVVADDGDGVPETEVEVITADGETALRHGSGVGLWLVRWGAEALGADIAFESPADAPGEKLAADGAPEGEDRPSAAVRVSLRPPPAE